MPTLVLRAMVGKCLFKRKRLMVLSLLLGFHSMLRTSQFLNPWRGTTRREVLKSRERGALSPLRFGDREAGSGPAVQERTSELLRIMILLFVFSDKLDLPSAEKKTS